MQEMILLREINTDDADVLNGIVLIPKGMYPEVAMEIIETAYKEVRNLHPDDWNYDDLYEYLERDGLKVIADYGVWDEPR